MSNTNSGFGCPYCGSGEDHDHYYKEDGTEIVKPNTEDMNCIVKVLRFRLMTIKEINDQYGKMYGATRELKSDV
jgi:hypothetical protein